MKQNTNDVESQAVGTELESINDKLFSGFDPASEVFTSFDPDAEKMWMVGGSKCVHVTMQGDTADVQVDVTW